MARSSFPKLGALALAAVAMSTVAFVASRQLATAGDGPRFGATQADAESADSISPYGNPIVTASASVPAPPKPAELVPTGAAAVTGRWQHSNCPQAQVNLDFNGRQLTGTFDLSIEGHKVTTKFLADYTVTSGDIVYGVVQCVDLSVDNPKANEEGDVGLELQVLSTAFMEQPFAFRYYRDAGGLTIKDVKLGILAGLTALEGDEDALQPFKAMFLGRYTAPPQKLERAGVLVPADSLPSY